MDALYFRTYDKDATMQELGFEKPYPTLLQTENMIIAWLGQLPQEVDKDGNVVSYQPGEYFNLYTKGQDMMDYVSTLRSATLLPEPATPNVTLG